MEPMADSMTAEAARPERTRARRLRLGLALLGVAGLLVVAGAVGHLNRGDRVWVGHLLDHPYPFGVAAAALITVAIAQLFPDRPGVVVFGCAGAAVVGVLWAMMGVFSSGFAPDEVAVVAAPWGTGADYEAVVRFTSDDVIDPAWTVAIRQTGRGLADKEWSVGCIGGRATRDSFDHVEWRSRRHLLVVLRRGSLDVTVSPFSGEPERPKEDPWSSC